MTNSKPLILAALRGVPGVADVFWWYPSSSSFAALPVISYYEAVNIPAQMGDNREYLSEQQFVVDVWGKTSDEADGIAAGVDAALAGIGCVREFCADVRDDNAAARHKSMRFQLVG